MGLKDNPAFADALARTCAEVGLADYYQPSVRPLFSMPDRPRDAAGLTRLESGASSGGSAGSAVIVSAPASA